MDRLKTHEKSFLLQSSSFTESTDSTDSEDELSRLVGRGSYIEALKSPSCQAAVGSIGQRTDDNEHHLTSAFKSYLSSHGQGDAAQHVILSIGVSSLQLFVQSNFTGPLLVPTLLNIFPVLEKENETAEEFTSSTNEYIARDTEGVYPLLKNSEYLMLAKVVFCTLGSELCSCFTIDWWAMRCDMVLQIVADEHSSAIYNRMEKSIASMEKCEIMTQEEDLKALFYIEVGQAYLLYSDVRRAALNFKKADSVLKLQFELSGAMGKRTKYQQDAKPQLVLKVKYEDQPLLASEAEGPKLLPGDLPKDLQLNDDTRLPHIKFEEEDEDKVPSLVPIEQLVILVKLQHMRRSAASDLQLQEESKAYLNALLQYPKCWVIQYNCLLLRSLIESEESRAMDRSLEQMNELVDCFTREVPSRFERLKLFYASNLPASWVTKQKCGKMLVQLGCTKTALIHFEELQLWEDVIDCYNRIQMRQRSEEIVRKMLEKEETPKLYCLLGDATDQIEHYKKAWELSDKKSSRAQRSLGDYYFDRQNFAGAIEHYKISLDVCHIQIKVWARLGYAALQTEDWKLCCKSYRMCTVLEPDLFEYWNNLGKAHANLNDFPSALQCLKEAARLRSDSWKIFQNVMITAATVGRLSDTIEAYKRLLALEPRHVHIPVISKMVQMYLTNYGEEGCEKAYKQLVSFISSMCNNCPSDSELWYCYGAIVSVKPNPTVESRDLACQHFRKSLMTYARGSTWYKETEKCKNALMKLLKVEESLMESVEGVAPETALGNVRSVAMSVKNVVTLARKGVTNVATGEVVPDCEELLSKGEAAVARIDDLINTLVGKTVAK